MRAGSSWQGWEEGEEDEGEVLHRCNPDWKGRGVGLHPLTDSSHEQTVRRALQSVGQKKGGQCAQYFKRTAVEVPRCDTYCRVWLWGGDR